MNLAKARMLLAQEAAGALATATGGEVMVLILTEGGMHVGAALDQDDPSEEMRAILGFIDSVGGPAEHTEARTVEVTVPRRPS